MVQLCVDLPPQKQTTLLTWGCRPHFVVSLPSWRKKNNTAERHQVLTYWRERSFMIKRAEFWYISEIWLFLLQSDKLTSMSHHILHHLESDNPSIVSQVLSHDLMKSAVYIFSAFISQQHWKQKTKKNYTDRKSTDSTVGGAPNIHMYWNFTLFTSIYLSFWVFVHKNRRLQPQRVMSILHYINE